MTVERIAAALPHDKTLHAIAGALAALAGLAGGHLVQWAPLACAAGVCAAAAIGREVVNHRAGGRFDLRDIVWTVIGGAVVIAAAWVGA